VSQEQGMQDRGQRPACYHELGQTEITGEDKVDNQDGAVGKHEESR
jgi:hypothetical protein